MKFPHLCLAVSLGTIACGGEDTGTSASLGSIGINPVPGLDAGAAPAPGSDLPPIGNTPGGVNPSDPSGMQVPSGNNAVCEVQTIDSGRVTPDMLIVLDRSGSMRNNGVNRWDPSVGALKTLTTQLGGAINFGLMTYPGASMAAPVPTQDCSALPDLLQQIACIATEAAGGVATLDTCVPGSLDVPIATNNGAAIGAALDRMAPQGATPTAASLKAAHTALGSVMAAVDDVARPKYVLLVTDGAPNCSNGGGGGGRGGGGFDNQAVEQSVAEITAMAKDGIKTFVIGYGTKSDRQLSAALDRMAQAGNTGDQQHHAIEDGDSLLTEFQKIAGAAASCEFTLNKQPTNPTFVEVKIDGAQVAYNDPNGWVLSDDRKRITLQGDACATLSSKDQHLLSVRVLCAPVVLQ